MNDIFEGAIGIDLGTTYSCVTVFLHDRVEVIPNDRGDRTTPSCVALHNGEILVGDRAAKLVARGDTGAVFDAKRMIGCHFQDAVIQEQISLWPFRVVCSGSEGDKREETEEASEGEIRVRLIDSKTGTVLYLAPEQISAEVLKYLKKCAETYIGKRVQKAVITVPAYFNDAQRERTKVAATIAGLEVLRLVNEPTAAALAYGFDAATESKGSSASSTTPRDVLVFDFGGGTFDVSIISIDGSFEVRATSGDTHLGGQDLDAAIIQHVESHLLRAINESSGGSSTALLKENTKLQARLKTAAERAKRELSFSVQTELTLENALPDGDDFVLQLSRSTCENLFSPMFARCLTIVKNALSDAKISKDKLHAIILVGGSSRIPKLAELLSSFVGPSVQLCRSIHPDEAVGIGAAVQGSILSTAPEQQSAHTAPMVLMDVIPLSIGIDIDEGRMDVVVPRNTTIPYRTTKEYSTVQNNQKAVDIAIYEGERALTKFNHKLGEFSLEGIAPAKKGEPTITVTFSIDADGLLTVTATEEMQVTRRGKVSGGKGTGQVKSLTVRRDHGLTPEEIKRMVEEAQRFSKKDALTVSIMDAQTRLTEGFASIDNLLNQLTSTTNTSHGDGTISLSPRLQRRLKFVSHGKEWLKNRLSALTDEEEVNLKSAKITQLQSKAIRALKKEMTKLPDRKREEGVEANSGLGMKRPREDPNTPEEMSSCSDSDMNTEED